jgi:hypothetical protein
MIGLAVRWIACLTAQGGRYRRRLRTKENLMTHNAGPLLAIAFYDGEYSGDLTALVHLCDLDGSVVPEGRPPFSLLEEALQLLEMSADKYSAPRPLSDYFTVFVGRKIGAEIRQLTRLDVVAQNGNVRASIMSADSPRIDT